MKRNSLTVIVGILLLVVFVLLLFTYQVRQTEVAVVTTFDRPTAFQSTPGLKWRLPAPINKVIKFDKRIHNFEGRYDEVLTADYINIMALVYVGWTIDDPRLFFNSFPGGKPTEAEPALEGLVRSSKAAVIGQHPFSHLISTDAKELKFVEIEKEIKDAISKQASSQYGISVKFVGLKRLGLPEGVTEKVLARMTAERQREVEKLKSQGEADAIKIKSAADRDRAQILAEAEAKATVIRGEADAEAAKWFAVFNQEPRLAEFLIDITSLEQSLKDKTTLVFDERIRPFNRLIAPAGSLLPVDPQSKQAKP